MYKHFFKRVLDFLISLIAIICLSPFLLVMIVWLHFANKGAGVFFLQDRPGKDAKLFNVIKFKSMTDERGFLHTGFKLSTEGETLTLSNANGQPVDTVTYDLLRTDSAYLRSGDGWSVGEPTM